MMKRLLSIICLAVMLMSFSVPMFALAAEPESTAPIPEKQPSNVTITVVMPDPVIPPEPDEPVIPQVFMFPSDVTETVENGVRYIVKTYELTADEKPEDISRETFVRGGYTYTLTDIIRKETASAETRDHLEVVTVNTETKELEQILPLLAPTMEYTAEDGFVGVLSLDVATLKVETAGTKTSSFTMTVTREYPHLSANDTSLVPKTVEEKGKTYTLAGVDWRTGNYETIDYEQVAQYYTAVASYAATGSSTKVTGYNTTVEYNGTIAKLTQGKTYYIAYFEGEEIRTPLEMTELATAETPTEPLPETEITTEMETTSEVTAAPSDDTAETTAPDCEVAATPPAEENTAKNNYGVWLAIIPCIAVLTGGTYYFMKKRKVDTNNEKTGNSILGSGDDVVNSDSDSRG